jgi:hypothetical protein
MKEKIYKIITKHTRLDTRSPATVFPTIQVNLSTSDAAPFREALNAIKGESRNKNNAHSTAVKKTSNELASATTRAKSRMDVCYTSSE